MGSLVPASLCLWLCLGESAHAADASQFWPELSAYVGLNDRSRVYLDASYASGKESPTKSLDTSAYLDLSLQPVLRADLRSQDWQRSRYLWTRIGLTRVFQQSDGSTQVAEDRGVLSIYSKTALPAEVWLEGRARADLRWIGGDYSTRYRFKLEATREFTMLEHTVVPYVNAEAFYDTRYAGWSRMLYQGGAEVAMNKHFRWEVYLAYQSTRLPSPSSLDALGVVAKWYY